jgi:hypothetical protein
MLVFIPVLFSFFSEVQYGITANVDKVVDSCKRNKVILKGIISSPLHSNEGILQTLNMRIRFDMIKIKTADFVTVEKFFEKCIV